MYVRLITAQQLNSSMWFEPYNFPELETNSDTPTAQEDLQRHKWFNNMPHNEYYWNHKERIWATTPEVGK